MSGGYWDYTQYLIEDYLLNVANDEFVKKRFPILAEALSGIGCILYNFITEIDYDLSGDDNIEDDKIFEKEAMEGFKKIICNCISK